MIPVHCYTFIDDYRTKEWPTKLCCRPIIGDKIRSVNGQVELSVASIIHTGDKLVIYLDKDR